MFGPIGFAGACALVIGLILYLCGWDRSVVQPAQIVTILVAGIGYLWHPR